MRFGDLGKTIYHPIDQSPSGVMAMQRITQNDGSTIRLKRRSVNDHGQSTNQSVFPNQTISNTNSKNFQDLALLTGQQTENTIFKRSEQTAEKLKGFKKRRSAFLKNGLYFIFNNQKDRVYHQTHHLYNPVLDRVTPSKKRLDPLETNASKLSIGSRMGMTNGSQTPINTQKLLLNYPSQVSSVQDVFPLLESSLQ